MSASDRKPLVISGEWITAPVTPQQQAIIRGWAESHVEDLRHALRRTGIDPNDVILPEYRRFVYADEVGAEAES